VELKVNHVSKDDKDYISHAVAIAQSKGGISDVEASLTVTENMFFNEAEVKQELDKLSGDTFLSDMVTMGNPIGYSLYKSSTSFSGASLDEIAAFATTELRMRALARFVENSYPNHLLRERQDTKARYEVASENIRLAQIFANIEENKEALYLSDYGVSQTSLEQVFNIHASEAEKLKQGRNDG
jgi:hypothetical protein